jgi:hypothetical protein
VGTAAGPQRRGCRPRPSPPAPTGFVQRGRTRPGQAPDIFDQARLNGSAIPMTNLEASEAGRVQRRRALARDLPIHTDPHEAAASTFGGLIASGVHTMAMNQHLMARTSSPASPSSRARGSEIPAVATGLMARCGRVRGPREQHGEPFRRPVRLFRALTDCGDAPGIKTSMSRKRSGPKVSGVGPLARSC